MHTISRRLALWTAAAACLIGATGCSGSSAEPAGPSSAPAASSPASAPGSSAAATSGSSATPATPAVNGTDRFTVVATGDVLLHPDLWAQARRDAGGAGGAAMDFRPMLAGIKPYVSKADLAICHLETPLAAPGGPFRGYPDFSGPPQIVTALKSTGYDACSTASNHTLDQGAAGISRTLTALDKAGIAHAGSARNVAESTRITMIDVHGTRVALLSYAYGFNGHTYPGGKTWLAHRIDPGQVVDDAKRARANGAQVVIAALHWGTEYQQTPSRQQLDLAPVLARSGQLDLIISHHSHVVEPIQRINGVWVTYGLGNLIAFHSTPGDANQEGLLASFTFTRAAKPQGPRRWTVSRASYLPLLVTRTAPIRLLSVPMALRTGEYGSTSKARLTEALNRTSQVVTSRGASGQGLTRLR